MKLIVGLGNPGEKYEKTRHNVGFNVLDLFYKNFSPVNTEFTINKKFKAEMVEIIWQPKKGLQQKAILLKPLTYMNGSGETVKLASIFYKIKPEDIWIVHDEIDLPLGAMKIRLGGSSAGHKGVMSIIEQLKSDKFWRFRIGIGSDKLKFKDKKIKARNIDDYVLGEFIVGEKGKIRESVKKGVKALEEALEHGLERAANRYNTK